MGAAIIIILIDFVLCNFICRSLLVQPLTMVHLNWNNFGWRCKLRWHTPQNHPTSVCYKRWRSCYTILWSFMVCFCNREKNCKSLVELTKNPNSLLLFCWFEITNTQKSLHHIQRWHPNKQKGKNNTQKQTVNSMCTVQHSVHSVWMCQ